MDAAPAEQNPTTDRLADLSAVGVAVWLDDLSRTRIHSGELSALIERDHVVGVTTNPTIFAGALAQGAAYESQIAELAAAGTGVDAAILTLTTDDVREACDVLRPVYEATNGRDGRVSIEVDPRLARDADATIVAARQLWALVDRPNMFVKIPATAQGLPAISAAISAGISVNVTLIFSLDRYRAVANAYLDGLEKARLAGIDLAGIASVASFFVSRVDTAVDKRLDALDSRHAARLRGQLAIANARLAYEAFEEIFSTPRWQDLSDSGARPQRPLWASTGVKDPAYPDTRYVDELAAPDVVNTMPAKTLRAVADHGDIRGDTIHGTYEESQGVLDAVERLGISYPEVTATLENEGVASFEKSWAELGATVASALASALVTDVVTDSGELGTVE